MVSATGNVVKVSPSSLNILRECPRCFWLALNGHKRPSGPIPTIGRALDTTIRRWWDDSRATGKLPARVCQLPELVELGAEPVDPSVKAWFDPETGLRLDGRLDACLRLPSGLYVPVDHKTRGYPPKEVHPAYESQLDAYSLLLEKNNRPPADFALLLYFVPDGGDPDAGTKWLLQAQRVNTSRQRAYDLMVRAQETLSLTYPPPHADECEHGEWTAADKGYA